MQFSIDEVLFALGSESVSETRARFLNDVDFYLEVAGEMLDDPSFELLGTQLSGRNAEGAFDTAHMLKGTISKCGITPLYRLIVPIVEELRFRRTDAPENFSALYSQLLDRRKLSVAILRRYIAGGDDTTDK